MKEDLIFWGVMIAIGYIAWIIAEKKVQKRRKK
jgi:hypothetical protein